jgi:hypothetical protein
LEPPEPTAEPDEGGGASREAASYRRRLRDTEAERDGLRERVDELERAEVERFAAEAPYWMIQPGDLWQVGVTLADIRGEDGRLDPTRLRDTLREVLETRPTWRRPVDLGTGPRGMPPGDERKPGLSALLGRR